MKVLNVRILITLYFIKSNLFMSWIKIKIKIACFFLSFLMTNLDKWLIMSNANFILIHIWIKWVQRICLYIIETTGVCDSQETVIVEFYSKHCSSQNNLTFTLGISHIKIHFFFEYWYFNLLLNLIILNNFDIWFQCDYQQIVTNFFNTFKFWQKNY